MKFKRSGTWGVATMASALMAMVGSKDAAAGAWTLKAGEGQAIVTGLYSEADAGFDSFGDVNSDVDFAKGTVSALVEYGHTDWLTFLGEAEIGSSAENGLPFARPALSNFAGGARMRVFEAEGFVASAQLTARFEDAFGEADAAVDTFGWEAPQIESRLLLGYGFELWDYPIFLDVQAGYRARVAKRDEGFDEVRLDFTAGVRPRSDMLLLLQSFSTIAAAGPESARLPDYHYHKAQASVVYDLNEKWSLQAGGFATVAGKNALREQGVTTAVWYRF
ncbi:hypothetical protein [Jiella marina]|uniref:hypothetical protein n=1 Tax=Jiella sp. LLJ827 TaxID=2917712 RepID=UPI0021019B39|nr:hypothetical protein [Jiella sp. LLJ827]MCQ0990274.1 hypothetical protein [Jiella sp. LLJ827]